MQSLVRSQKAEREVEGNSHSASPTVTSRWCGCSRHALPPKLVRHPPEYHRQYCALGGARGKGPSADASGAAEFSAPRAIVTLPLGVMQAAHSAPGAVCFEPALREKASSLLSLYMGQTIRISLVFSQRWWEQAAAGRESGALNDMSIVFSHQEWFPTWWTHGTSAPILTGWAASRRGERLSGKTGEFIRDKALESLANIFEFPPSELQATLQSWHVHDWRSDPYARGSYSYVGVGGEGAQAELAASLAGTLFFAGEATNSDGHHGTVHGAIATGERAARELLR